MNNKRMLLILISMACIAVVIETAVNKYLLPDNIVTGLVADHEADASPPKHVEGTAPVDTVNTLSIASLHSTEANSEASSSDSGLVDESNPYQEAAMKAQLMQVADLYEEAVKYPPSSQPIVSVEQLAQYLPHQSSAVGYPFEVDGLDEPIHLSLKTSKFQYFLGESIPVYLDVDGLPEEGSFDIESVLTTLSGEELMSVVMFQPNTSSNSFRANFDPQVSVSSRWPQELQVRVYAVVDGHRLFISSPLKYTSPSALLQVVEFSSVRDAYLDIPLQFEVTNPGYYFVQANLYSQQSGKPLLHLESEGRMEDDTSRLMFSAYADALKLSGDEGPYILKDFNIVRSADDNDQYDTAGASSSEAYLVEGFAFSDYQDTPYQDPLAQERLDFLRELGQL